MAGDWRHGRYSGGTTVWVDRRDTRDSYEWRDDWRRDVDRRPLDVRVAGIDLVRGDPAAGAAWAGRRMRHHGRHFHSHHRFPWPLLVLAFFFVGGSGLFTALALAAVTAVFALACVALAMYIFAPGLLQTVRGALAGEAREAEPEPAYQPASLSSRYAAGQLTHDEFRRQLIDVLKQRYVRGELTTAEFEDHLSRILRDPVA
jgi:uncharacterized membrane protein